MSELLSKNWDASRSGARASRGFHYQDAVTALLITKVWSGEIKSYVIVPEGHDDITLEDGHTAHLVQIKSKSASAIPFQASDIKSFEKEIEARSEKLRQSGLTIASKSVILERALPNLSSTNIDQFMKKELPDKALKKGSYLCKQSARDKIQRIQKVLESKLRAEGLACEVHPVPPAKDDGFFWPVSNFAILVRTNTILDFLSSLDRVVALTGSQLPQIHVAYILPVINEKIIGQSAMQSRGERPLPCPDIGDLLGGTLPIPFMEGSTAKAFDAASSALIECACIAAVRDLSALHPEEARAFDSAQDRFKQAFTTISELSATDADENLALAKDVLALMEDALRGGESGLQRFPSLASIPGLALSQQMDEQLGLLIVTKNHLTQYDAAKLSRESEDLDDGNIGFPLSRE